MDPNEDEGGDDLEQSGHLAREKSVSDPAIDRGVTTESNLIDIGDSLGHRRRRWQQDDILIFRPFLGGSHHLLWSSENRWPLLSENRSQYVKHEFARRAEILRRCTELRLGGEFAGKPEYLEKYRGTPGERAKIARRRTTLSLPGGVVATPEYRECYVDFPRSRPRPAKRKDCLMPLEGSVEKESEVRSKYVAHPAGRRAELQRKNTNLSLEGEMECKAEYRESFIDFPRHRPCVEKPEGQLLRQDGPLQCDPEYRSSFVDFPRERPLVSKPSGALKLDGETYFNAEYKERYVDFPRERPRANKPGGDLKIHETEGEFKYTPEYRERYVDFPRERPRCSKPSGDLKPEGDFEEMTSEVRSRYVWLEGADRQPAAKRQESLAAASTQNGESYLMPEYRERYVTFPRERPRRRKPESQIKPPEVTVTPEETEVKAKFTGEAGRRAEMVKREASLKLEGELIARPEYRDQYVAPPPPAPREHPDDLDDHEVDVHGSPKRTETTASTLRPPDSILPHSDSGGDSTPPKSKSPTRVVPRPIGRRRRSVSASEVKEEIVSPYRAFRVLRSPYIGYEPSVMVKTDIGRRSPSLSPARRRREPKFADTKRKASFVVINEDRLDDMVPTRGRLRPCAASGCSNRGRWMPPWYTVPTVR